VDALVSWCRQGPPSARVDDVAVTDVEPSGATSFDITD
jgi:acylphosphatase